MSRKKRFKKVHIEISNNCNLNCDFCPMVNRPKQVMSTDLFRKVMSDVAPLSENVALHLMGEPTMHPDFSEIIKICHRFGTPVNLVSNGSILNESVRESLFDPIISQVSFSVHSFEANHRDKDISPYLEKILKFCEESFKRNPDLFINFRLWNLSNFEEDLKSRNSDIIKKIFGWFGLDCDPEAIIMEGRSSKVYKRLFLNFDTMFDWPSLDQPFCETKGFCVGMMTQLGVHADGTVVPCCMDKDAVINLGNLKTMSLSEVLGSGRTIRLVRGFDQGELVEDLCQHCSWRQRFKVKQKYRR